MIAIVIIIMVVLDSKMVTVTGFGPIRVAILVTVVVSGRSGSRPSRLVRVPTLSFGRALWKQA